MNLLDLSLLARKKGVIRANVKHGGMGDVQMMKGACLVLFHGRLGLCRGLHWHMSHVTLKIGCLRTPLATAKVGLKRVSPKLIAFEPSL